MTTSTTVSDLKINKLTSAQFTGITPSSTELYFVTDDSGITAAEITSALGYTPAKKIVATNPALTVTGGVCTWSISQNIGVGVQVSIYEITSGEQVMPESITTTATTAVVKFLATSNIPQNTYRAIIQG